MSLFSKKIAWIGSQSKIQPFVVAVDSLGAPVAVARPQALARGAQLDERVIRSQLATFITNSRSLLSDTQGQPEDQQAAAPTMSS